MALDDLEGAWRVWTLLEATGWRWPPDVLMRQPEALMDDLLNISFVSRRVKDSLEGK